MTPLEQRLLEMIAHEGPIPLDRYMTCCLQHYYATRDPLGAAGDFTTAPEISQMFGELIGLWAAEIWHGMGRPSPLRLIELGPGRGTLMADALRAARLVPDLLAAATIHLVETSPVLRKIQTQTLAGLGAKISWHDKVADVPPGPTILLANEFLDALPIRQFVATERGWCERLIGIEGDRLAYGLSPDPTARPEEPPRLGAVLEWPAAAMAATKTVAARLAADGGAALIVDYGHWGPAFEDTFQAVKAHTYADPLASPGEADLTTHVDFRRIAQTAAAEGVRVHGPVTQGEFLKALGIEARAATLKQRATAGQAAEIDRAVVRLTGSGREAMGELFKVLAFGHPDLPTLPGLSPTPDDRLAKS